MKPTKPTYADLQRQITELKAQMAHTLKNARRNMHKAGEPLHASAVIVTLTALGGREIMPPFAIRDGLSPETIHAFILDLDRTAKLSGYEVL